MALQFQAGVLTEEMVLAVQGLVEVSYFSAAHGLFREQKVSRCLRTILDLVLFSSGRQRVVDLQPVSGTSTCEVLGKLRCVLAGASSGYTGGLFLGVLVLTTRLGLLQHPHECAVEVQISNPFHA